LLRAFGGDTLAVGAGISAMPSVHNALAILFAFAAWRVNKPLGSIFAAYAVLIWVGSIHLGWHYAIDGLAAAGLTLGIWLAVGRVTKRLEGRLAPQVSQPALA
jgi:membrane-associated phospholipid phosphatase